MKEGQSRWTREQSILVMNLYCKIPFGKMHKGNPDVIHLARLIDRTPDAIAYKLGNFASLDPSLKARGVKGLSQTSKLDEEIWDEFYYHWDVLPYESEKLLAVKEHTTIEALNHILEEEEISKEGKTREQLVKVRVNQSFFRQAVLSSYNFKCCITGIDQRELLIAGHIRPWGIDEKNRLNPSNGLALNALHDRAFEAGYITITPDYKIKVSSTILQQQNVESLKGNFHQYDGKEIIVPSKFLPDVEFLKYHNEERFRK